MSTTLVDTAAWIALVNTRDELHERAKDVMIELRRNNVALVTTEFVLLEVANTFCASAWRGKAVKLIDGYGPSPISKLSKRTAHFYRNDGNFIVAGRIRIGALLTALVLP
jgi:predicted nucleic acid-binding protein